MFCGLSNKHVIAEVEKYRGGHGTYNPSEATLGSKQQQTAGIQHRATPVAASAVLAFVKAGCLAPRYASSEAKNLDSGEHAGIPTCCGAGASTDKHEAPRGERFLQQLRKSIPRSFAKLMWILYSQGENIEAGRGNLALEKKHLTRLGSSLEVLLHTRSRGIGKARGASQPAAARHGAGARALRTALDWLNHESKENWMHNNLLRKRLMERRRRIRSTRTSAVRSNPGCKSWLATCMCPMMF